MCTPLSTDIEAVALIRRLKEDVALARRLSPLAARLLETAILDLQMVTFSISDEELKAFTEALEREVSPMRQSNGMQAFSQRLSDSDYP